MSILPSPRPKSRRCCATSRARSGRPRKNSRIHRRAHAEVRAALVGTAPAGINYRFAITYENEELRQVWLASDIHQEVWGGMESMLSSPNYDVLLFDVV